MDSPWWSYWITGCFFSIEILVKSIIAKISKFISKIHIPYNHKKMTEEECQEVISILRPGDVVLSHTDGELSNIFLEYWGHGMIISNSGLYESVTSGVRKTDMMYSFSRKDDLIVLRHNFELNTMLLGQYCNYALGTLYDYNFETSAEKIYCFELVVDAIRYSSKFDCNIFLKKTLIGRQYLGSSFFNENFDVVWKKNK